ncbi:MAG: zinc-binding dehydrogenase [Novosphingobium sp.]|nr:zinc-binding dehydrogenase [Novosphingobium sp.]
MSDVLPNGGLQIRSTVTEAGKLEIVLAHVPILQPEADQLVVRVEAAPINPSDIIPLLAGNNPADATFEGPADEPRVMIDLSPDAQSALAGRVGQAMPVGLEGAGIVVAAGEQAQHLLGKRVAFLSLSAGSFGEYCTVALSECAPLPEGVTAREGADLFCNPMTVMAMVETLAQMGETAMIHTAAASNLGQMLVKVCAQDGIPLVNVVRREEHVELLRRMGAEHVCNSSTPTFGEDLARAVAATGATVAFDAIGGGTMASELLVAMEAGAAARMPAYSAYGSRDMKHVYIYGLLDPGPTQLSRQGYGMLWNVEGWAMPPILERAGAERAMALTQRVVDNITTTFASDYGHEISLAEALQRESMLGFCRKATGEKYLIVPDR